jgi:hypothetical protein
MVAITLRSCTSPRLFQSLARLAANGVMSLIPHQGWPVGFPTLTRREPEDSGADRRLA